MYSSAIHGISVGEGMALHLLNFRPEVLCYIFTLLSSLLFFLRIYFSSFTALRQEYGSLLPSVWTHSTLPHLVTLYLFSFRCLNYLCVVLKSFRWYRANYMSPMIAQLIFQGTLFSAPEDSHISAAP